MDGPLLTNWTIRLALACYVVLLAGLIIGEKHARQSRTWRAVSTVGCLLSVAHVACAFHFYHHWSHADAAATTAAATSQLIGWEFAGGIYFNYAFLLLWIADVGWWWSSRQSYAARKSVLNYSVHAYMIFIAVNGAIVFEDGTVRWFGLTAGGGLVALICGKVISKKWRNPI